MRTCRFTILATAALVLAGCGGDDDAAADPTEATDAPPPTGATTTPATQAETGTDADAEAEADVDVDAAVLGGDGTFEGTLEIDGATVDLVRRADSINWCHYYEGESLGISGQAEGGDPFFQLNHDQLKVDPGDDSYYTLPDEKILTIGGEHIVGSDTGGTITLTRDGGAFTLMYDGTLQGIGSNGTDSPETIDVHIDIACER